MSKNLKNKSKNFINVSKQDIVSKTFQKLTKKSGNHPQKRARIKPTYRWGSSWSHPSDRCPASPAFHAPDSRGVLTSHCHCHFHLKPPSVCLWSRGSWYTVCWRASGWASAPSLASMSPLITSKYASCMQNCVFLITEWFSSERKITI